MKQFGHIVLLHSFGNPGEKGLKDNNKHLFPQQINYLKSSLPQHVPTATGIERIRQFHGGKGPSCSKYYCSKGNRALSEHLVSHGGIQDAGLDEPLL